MGGLFSPTQTLVTHDLNTRCMHETVSSDRVAFRLDFTMLLNVICEIGGCLEIIITEWALQSYLQLKHQGAFSRDDYKKTIRPDVELLKDGYPSPPCEV